MTTIDEFVKRVAKMHGMNLSTKLVAMDIDKHGFIYEVYAGEVRCEIIHVELEDHGVKLLGGCAIGDPRGGATYVRTAPDLEALLGGPTTTVSGRIVHP